MAEGGDPAVQGQARGRVQNSAGRTWDVAGGLAWIGATRAHPGIAANDGANIRRDMRQSRVDLRGALPLGGAFKEVKLCAGRASDALDERDATSAIGTCFLCKNPEGRIAPVQANNILDGGARRPSGFLKGVAPLPGRDTRGSLRVAI